MACLIVLNQIGRNMKQFRVALLTSLIATSGMALAVSDGSTETTSTGTSRVSITKHSIVQLTGVEDLVFRNVGHSDSNVEISMDICVNTTAAKYSITVTSGNRAFSVANAHNNIPYTVTWDGVGVTYSSTVAGLMGTSDINCSDEGEGNARLAVNFDPEDFNSVPAGMYSDVLTIAIAPE